MAAAFMTAFFLLFLRYSFCDWKVHFFFFLIVGTQHTVRGIFVLNIYVIMWDFFMSLHLHISIYNDLLLNLDRYMKTKDYLAKTSSWAWCNMCSIITVPQTPTHLPVGVCWLRLSPFWTFQIAIFLFIEFICVVLNSFIFLIKSEGFTNTLLSSFISPLCLWPSQYVILRVLLNVNGTEDQNIELEKKLTSGKPCSVGIS